MFSNRVAVNIAYILGNSPLRIAGVGWDDRPATERERANMKALLRTGMEEGASACPPGSTIRPGAMPTRRS